ncbi:MAG: N-6 DNA methylase [Rhodothermaceae bacterium]|nr:N-6 DNA methylase [Rhodothermaceae bacterium]MYF63278.1 N-6 DNA methylase [Rhodothermaceae bacterium]MYI84118.1 N-6 DNA methylase [Rhodothermaceae bacterium]
METPLFHTIHAETALTKDSAQATRAQSRAKEIRDRVSKYLETALVEDDSPVLVRDTDRVNHYGEVFTPNWLVKRMLDYLRSDPVADLDKSVLDPSCGSGQFLTEALRRKLVTAAKLFGDSLDYEQYEFDCMRALSKLYGIDINADTAEEALERMATIVFKAYEAVNGCEPDVDFNRAVRFILQTNIVVGDFLSENYSLVEWIPHTEHSFERKVWPAEVICSKHRQKGTLFEEIMEPSEILPPAHWSVIAAGSES